MGPGATVLSVSLFGNEKVVKISVPSFQALLDYKPNVDEITAVVTSDLCPDGDITAIIALCRELDFTYEGRLPDANAKASKPNDDNAEDFSVGEGKNQV